MSTIPDEEAGPLKQSAAASGENLERRYWWPRKQNGDKPDPPHPIGVIAQVLGPAITVIAVLVALKGLAISDRGMRIAQRAYIVVEPVLGTVSTDDEPYVYIDFKVKERWEYTGHGIGHATVLGGKRQTYIS